MTTVNARSTSAKLGNALLSVAAFGGVVCILLVILAVVFDITLVMFKTGSMSPTIPTGSLAVVREIPATEARVGDVVTIDRAGELPITHRITSVAQQGDGVVSITMRGDANSTDDPAPYVVRSVRIVLVSAAGLGYAVAAVSNPIGTGVLTLVATGIVTWAFWPRNSSAHRGRRLATEAREGHAHPRRRSRPQGRRVATGAPPRRRLEVSA